MNNADLAIEAVRKTQEYVFDRNASPNSTFQLLEQNIEHIRKASKQINTYEGQLNRIINILSEKGMFNGEVIAAFTGLSVDKAKELEGKLEEVREKILT